MALWRAKAYNPFNGHFSPYLDFSTGAVGSDNSLVKVSILQMGVDGNSFFPCNITRPLCPLANYQCTIDMS